MKPPILLSDGTLSMNPNILSKFNIFIGLIRQKEAVISKIM